MRRFKLKGLNIYEGDVCIGYFRSDRINSCVIRSNSMRPDLPRQLADEFGIFVLEVEVEYV